MSDSDQLAFYTAMSASNKERVMDADMFLKGQIDCRDGKPHEAGKGESYDRGYAAQYEWEQAQGAMTHGD